jgi:hypothetical protein
MYTNTLFIGQSYIKRRNEEKEEKKNERDDCMIIVVVQQLREREKMKGKVGKDRCQVNEP